MQRYATHFYDNEEYVDFLNPLSIYSNFPTRCWEKASLSHGWRIDAGYVRYHIFNSKYLVNLVFVVCKNCGISFV